MRKRKKKGIRNQKKGKWKKDRETHLPEHLFPLLVPERVEFLLVVNEVQDIIVLRGLEVQVHALNGAVGPDVQKGVCLERALPGGSSLQDERPALKVVLVTGSHFDLLPEGFDPELELLVVGLGHRR